MGTETRGNSPRQHASQVSRAENLLPVHPSLHQPHAAQLRHGDKGCPGQVHQMKSPVSPLYRVSLTCMGYRSPTREEAWPLLPEALAFRREKPACSQVKKINRHQGGWEATEEKMHIPMPTSPNSRGKKNAVLGILSPLLSLSSSSPLSFPSFLPSILSSSVQPTGS